jgi:ribosomal-protein-alanine N-acetyltransferase
MSTPGTQPVFTTARLELVPTQLSDVDTLWAIWTDPAVRRFLWDDRAINRDEATATITDCLALATEGLGLWTIVVPAMNDARVGCAGLLPVSTAAEFEPRLAGLVEPIVALAPGVWRHGYASEALDALVTYASTNLGLPRLAGVSDVPNVSSDRMLRRAGFVVLSEVPGPRYRLRTYVWEPAIA